MIILGIETSCDETAISVIEVEGDLENPIFKTLSHVVHSQIKDHEPFGGVVPNIAKREHIRNLPYVLVEALHKAGLILDFKFSILNKIPNENIPNSKARECWSDFFEQIPKIKIDLIVVTVGPGLEPALWTGIEFAKALGEKLGIKVIGANHMEGHIASVLFGKNKEKLNFPAIALLISGGHTELIYLKNWRTKEKIGETVDDAVGEAFDKVARMLSLPYPGGPQISKLADRAREERVSLNHKFPRPMINSGNFNFSFSGLKTAVLYYLKSLPEITDEIKLGVAREFEDSIIETIISKTQKAILEYQPKSLIVGGGVISNLELRKNILNLNSKFPELKILIPEKELTTDNATMIAIAGYLNTINKQDYPLEAQGNLRIT